MPRERVEALLYLLDQAYEGNAEHSFRANLRDLREGDWNTPATPGGRTIRALAAHVAAAKYMYDEYAFGPAKLTWPEFLANPIFRTDDTAAFLGWIDAGHRHLRASIAALDDAELAEPRKLNWGGVAETQWIISVLIQHDAYHAGEINEVRALLQGNDRWPWERPSQ
jgi:hypothetical protein